MHNYSNKSSYYSYDYFGVSNDMYQIKKKNDTKIFLDHFPMCKYSNNCPNYSRINNSIN